MKKVAIPLLLIAILLLVVIPAAAGGNGPQGPRAARGTPQATPRGTQVSYQQKSPRGTFAITGTIAAIDPVQRTVTVSTLRGNKLVQAYLGTDVMVTTTAWTRYLYQATANSRATFIAFEDLAIGDPVSVNGVASNGIWVVTRITVGASLSCLP
jgi:hypothetical protein